MPIQKRFVEDSDLRIKCIFGGNRQTSVDTIVYRGDGRSVQVGDVQIGDKILCRVGDRAEPREVLDIPFDGESDTYTIFTSNGYKIKASGNHCFPVSYRKREEKWTLDEMYDYFQTCKSARRSLHLLKPTEYIFDEVTKIPFEGVVLGLFLGDGSYGDSPSSGYPRINFTNSSDNIQKIWIDSLLKTHPDVESKAFPSDMTRLYMTKCKDFRYDLEALGLTVKAAYKFIPDIYKFSDIETRKGVLRGLFLTDGGKDKRKTSLYSSSFRLLKDAQFIIESLGGYANIYKEYEAENDNQHDGYKLQLSNQMLLDLDIGDLLHKQPDRIGRVNRGDLIITKIKKTERTRCRCLTVDCPEHQYILEGGYITYNSGKTEVGAYYIVKYCMDHPGSRCWAVAGTFKDSVEIQQRKIAKMVPQDEIKYGVYSHVNGYTNRKLIFKNGSMVTFKSYDQGVDSFQGDDIDLCWMDEEPPVTVYSETRMRLLDRGGSMVLTMTSLKGMTDLLQDLFDGYDTIQSQWAPHVEEDLPRVAENNGIRFYFLWTTENPYITQDMVEEEIKLRHKDEIKSRIYGLPINFIGKIYSKFNRDVHIVDDDTMPKGPYTLYQVADPHDRKPWACTWWAVNRSDDWTCVYEHPMGQDFNDMKNEDKTYDDYAQLFKEIEKKLKAIYKRTASRRIIDPNFGNKTIQLARRQGGQSKTTPKEEMRRRGFHFKDGIDALEAGHMAVRQALDWREKDGQITMQPKLKFHKRCQNAIKHMQRYQLKEIVTYDGDERDKVRPMDKYKDFPDNVRYFVMDKPRFFDNKRFEPSTVRRY